MELGRIAPKGQFNDALSIRHRPRRSHSSRNLRELLLEVNHFLLHFPLGCIRVFLRIGLRGRCDGLHRTRLLRCDPQLRLSRCRDRGSTAGRRGPQLFDVRMPDFALPVSVRGGGDCDNSATLWAIGADRLAAVFRETSCDGFVNIDIQQGHNISADPNLDLRGIDGYCEALQSCQLSDERSCHPNRCDRPDRAQCNCESSFRISEL
jgi:hypothetical protein